MDDFGWPFYLHSADNMAQKAYFSETDSFLALMIKDKGDDILLMQINMSYSRCINCVCFRTLLV
jgi:hypothetical protein